MLGIILSAITVAQGDAAVLRLAGEPDLIEASLQWNSAPVTLVPVAGSAASAQAAPAEWLALIGADIDTPAGIRRVPLRKRYRDGRVVATSIEVAVTDTVFSETRLDVERRFVDLSAADSARAVREAAEIDAIYETVSPGRTWQQPFIVPLPGIADGRNFGHRRFFNGEPRAPHGGADLRAAEGTPVLASNDGTVVLAEPLFFSGNAIFLDHGSGVYSVYLHLSEFAVSAGDQVRQGEVIGESGSTGRVTGPHLHWGVRILGARVDPFSLVRATAQ